MTKPIYNKTTKLQFELFKKECDFWHKTLKRWFSKTTNYKRLTVI